MPANKEEIVSLGFSHLHGDEIKAKHIEGLGEVMRYLCTVFCIIKYNYLLNLYKLMFLLRSLSKTKPY